MFGYVAVQTVENSIDLSVNTVNTLALSACSIVAGSDNEPLGHRCVIVITRILITIARYILERNILQQSYILGGY
jgi:hypothetical protein